MRPLITLLVLLWATPLFAQLTVADKYDSFQPIIAGCNCIVPESGEVRFMWQVDVASRAMPSDDNKKLYIWAPPGTHTVEAIVATTAYQELTVWVPDPNSPDDVTKAIKKTIKTLVSFDVQRYSKSYMVGPGPGPVPPGPPPGPGPGPGPSPNPLDDFASQALTWMKAVPSASYSKDKATAIADNYAAVAAQGAATALDLTGFVSLTKQLNQKKLTTDDIAAWATPFFNPLAQYQSKTFNDRKLTNTDTAGIAKIWNETADAIRKAAASMSGEVHSMVPVTPEVEKKRSVTF